jgi:hypothetical protein
MSQEKDCVVFRHARTYGDAGLDPNYDPPDPVVEFTGTQAECEAFVDRQNEDHDFANPGMFDSSPSRREVRRTRPSYRDTDPL